MRVGVTSGAIFSVISLFPTGSFHGENVALSAGEDRGDGRRIRDAGGRRPGDHRHAGYGEEGVDGRDRRAPASQLFDLRRYARGCHRLERHPGRSASPGRDRLLRLPHHGRPRDHLHRHFWRVSIHVVARAPLSKSRIVMDTHACDAVSLHREPCGMGGCRSGRQPGRLRHSADRRQRLKTSPQA